MEIVRRKNYRHFSYNRTQLVPVIELETLLLLFRDISDKKELVSAMTKEIMSIIDFEKLSRVNRILALESDRYVVSAVELKKIVYTILTNALTNFVTTHDVGFYDHETIGICIFVGKSGRHGITIYPKLDLPK